MYSIIDPVTYEQYDIFSVEGKNLLKKYVQSYQYMQKGGGDDEIESFSLNEDTYGEITYTPSYSLNPETLDEITYAPSLNPEERYLTNPEYVDIQRRPPEKKGTENQKGGAEPPPGPVPHNIDVDVDGDNVDGDNGEGDNNDGEVDQIVDPIAQYEQLALDQDLQNANLDENQLNRVVQYFINDFVQSNDQVNQFHFDPNLVPQAERSLRRLRSGVAGAIQVYNNNNGVSDIDLDVLAHGEDYIREINPEEWEHILGAATNNNNDIPPMPGAAGVAGASGVAGAEPSVA